MVTSQPEQHSHAAAGSPAAVGPRPDTDTRVVITGLGVVSPIGIGKEAFWKSLSEGKSGVGFLKSIPTDDLPIKLAAEITDFDPKNYIRERRFLKVMSRDIQLGVASAGLAMQDAGLKAGDVDPVRLGVEFGAGRMSTTPQELVQAVRRCTESDADSGSDMETASSGDSFRMTRWGEGGLGEIAPLWLLRQLPNMPACHVSIDHDARGPNNTITSRDSSFLLALLEAVRIIERDAADAMIVGACGSCIHPVDIAKLSLFENLSHRSDDPSRAIRPFDIDRDGTIVGEGAATFVVERYSHAVRRGATIYAEVLGVGAGCDGRGLANSVGGTGIVRAVEAALVRSRLDTSRLGHEIGHINAHGKSTLRDDRVESRALHRIFGDRAESVPLTALKSYFGHLDAGSGAVEMAGSLLALQSGTLPMTLGFETPDPNCRLNVIHDHPGALSTRTALSINRTNMGQAAAALIRAF